VELSKNSKNIHFCGHVPREQILVELRSSHIFALPSVKETFGLVFLEAAAAGNAIIGHTREGIWKQLTPDEEIIYAINYQHFSEVLHSFIADRSKINSFGRKANIKSRAFTWKKLTQKLNNYYEEILSEYS
jgi:glycosyltransferase involved in cell wall biosynthesis